VVSPEAAASGKSESYPGGSICTKGGPEEKCGCGGGESRPAGSYTQAHDEEGKKQKGNRRRTWGKTICSTRIRSVGKRGEGVGFLKMRRGAPDRGGPSWRRKTPRKEVLRK